VHRGRLALLLALLAPLAAAGEERAPDGPRPLVLRVGEAVELCRTGTVLCPAVAPICDDPSLVEFELTAAGLRFRGAKPGETLCSVRGSGGLGTRWVYRVQVVAAPPP
jgi:hypothetical protein